MNRITLTLEAIFAKQCNFPTDDVHFLDIDDNRC